MHLSLEWAANNKIKQKRGFKWECAGSRMFEFESEMDGHSFEDNIKDNLRIKLMKI